MRTGLRVAALFLALVSVVLWFFGGPNFGQTKTSITEMRHDESTGLDRPVGERRFLPGVDFLAAGLAGAALLAGAASLGGKKRP